MNQPSTSVLRSLQIIAAGARIVHASGRKLSNAEKDDLHQFLIDHDDLVEASGGLAREEAGELIDLATNPDFVASTETDPPPALPEPAAPSLHERLRMPLRTSIEASEPDEDAPKSAQVLPKSSAQDTPKNLSETPDSGCPRVPNSLEYDSSLNSLVEQVTKARAGLAVPAKPAPSSWEPVPPGEGKHGAPFGPRLAQNDASLDPAPVEWDADTDQPGEVDGDGEAALPVEWDDEADLQAEAEAGLRVERDHGTDQPEEVGGGQDAGSVEWDADAHMRGEIDEDEQDECADRGSGPPPRNLHYASLQLFHNRHFKKQRQAEWTLKLRWMGRAEPGVTYEHYVGFRPSPRKAREAVRRHAAEGKVSEAWAEAFAEATANLDGELRVGPLTRRMYTGQKRAPKGASINTREALEGCWATLALDPTAGKPGIITLHMAGDEPLVLSRFNPGTSRKANAAQWLALFDPEGLYQSKRELATLRRHLADERGLETYSPNTALGALVATQVLPVWEIVDRLSDQVEKLNQFVAKLAGDILDLKREAKTQPEGAAHAEIDQAALNRADRCITEQASGGIPEDDAG